MLRANLKNWTGICSCAGFSWGSAHLFWALVPATARSLSARIVAEELAQRYSYPFPDRDLVRVAQYAAVQSDPNAPKEDVVDIMRAAGPPKYSQPPQFGTNGEPHSTLADLRARARARTPFSRFVLRSAKFLL